MICIYVHADFSSVSCNTEQVINFSSKRNWNSGWARACAVLGRVQLITDMDWAGHLSTVGGCVAGSACQRPDCHASAIQTGVMDSTSRSSPPPARQPANSRCVVAVLTTPNHYGYMLYLGLFVCLFISNKQRTKVRYDTIRDAILTCALKLT